MGMMDIVRKVKASLAGRTDSPTIKRITNEEYELGIYKERERQDMIKKQVSYYRKQDSQNMLKGEGIISQKPTLFKQKNIMNSKKKLMGNGGVNL